MKITINLGEILFEKAYHDMMMEKCHKLGEELEKRCGSEHFDFLGLYRKWFDDQGIESEREDGWPEDFVFDEENIQAFVDHWKGGD